MESSNRFRAIIVGGGPVALTAAHSFTKAGIDFIVLEARDTFTPFAGSSLVLNPVSTRIFHQLGIGEEVEKVSSELRRCLVMDSNGRTYKDGNMFSAFKESHGEGLSMCHRADVVKILHDTLPIPAKNRVHAGKKIVEIRTQIDGVKVICADGSTYSGSIAIGADGVYSITRACMRRLALEASPGTTKINAEKPFTSYYNCMWGVAPKPDCIEPGINSQCHASGWSVLFMASSERCWFFLIKLLDEPTQEKKIYTDEEKEAYAKDLAHAPMAPGVLFREIWEICEGSGMSNLDEGIVDHWTWDRIALVGDAAHKVTPCAGWGLNSGIQDIVVLTNGLHKLLKDKTPLDKQSAITTEQIREVFEDYQKKREEETKLARDFSAGMTRQSAWSSGLKGWGYWIMECISTIVPHFDWYMVRYLLCRKCFSEYYPLDFLKGKEPFQGVEPWAHPILPLEEE